MNRPGSPRSVPPAAIIESIARFQLSRTRFHRALYRASEWRRGLAICEMLHAAVAP